MFSMLPRVVDLISGNFQCQSGTLIFKRGEGGDGSPTVRRVLAWPLSDN